MFKTAGPVIKRQKRKSNSLTFHLRILFHMKYPQYTAVTINQVSRTGGMTSEKRDGEYVCGGTNCLFSLSCCHSPASSRHHHRKGGDAEDRAEALAFLSLDESRKRRRRCAACTPCLSTRQRCGAFSVWRVSLFTLHLGQTECSAHHFIIASAVPWSV